MAAGRLVVVVGVVMLKLLLDNLLVVLLFLFLLFAVTRAGAIGHRGVLMGRIGCVGLARGRVRRGHERGMEGVRERLIILRIVHDFLGEVYDKSPEMGVTLRAESSNRCRQQQPNPVGTQPRRICPCTRRAFHSLVWPRKIHIIWGAA